MLEQTSRHPGHSGPGCLAPGVHPRADLVHQRDLLELSGIFEALRARRRHHIAGFPLALDNPEIQRLALEFPVPAGNFERRVEDEMGGFLGHGYLKSRSLFPGACSGDETADVLTMAKLNFR